MLVATAAGSTVDPHRIGAAVVHRARGICPGLRQGEPADRDVVQGHEEDAKS